MFSLAAAPAEPDTLPPASAKAASIISFSRSLGLTGMCALNVGS